MRYKKGSKVEVLSRNEVPSVFWRCAEIISGNGHNYTVRYDVYPVVTNDVTVERVSRKSIRPCPPSVELFEDWIPGDVVEVFQDLSWKMATVSKLLEGNHLLVRLVGSSQEFKMSKYDLRVRQSWQDDKWFVIGKGSRSCEDGRHNERSTLKYNRNSGFQIRHSGSQVKRADEKMNLHVEDYCFATQNHIIVQESRIVSSRSLKRGSPSYSQVEAYERCARKFRVTEKGGRCNRVLITVPFPSPEKVDAVASTREMLGEKQIHTSFNNRNCLSEMDLEREKLNRAFGCSRAISLGSNDDDSDTCSVGSCSVNNNSPYMLPCHWGPVEDTEGHSGDAESFCQVGYEEGICPPLTNEELVAEIHRLELHAYRCTIEALHASGPLSWDKETMVTNLRISLHISNDEHLMELRNLVSSGTSIPRS